MSAFSRLGLALASVAGALLITRLLQPTVFPTPLFFVAIVLTTWFGGAWPGVLSVVLATIVLQHFFVLPGTHSTGGALPTLYLAQFLVPALVTCWFVQKRKEAELALKQARDDLDAKVAKRTLELQHTNERLESEIVERKRTEDAFRQTQTDLAHLTRITTMSALATSIAHEVNQPLAAIVTTSEAGRRWLDNEPPNVERAKDSLTRIIQAATRAAGIVRRLRALSTKTEIHRTRVQVPELVAEVVEILKSEFARHSIELTTECDERLPEVEGDRVQLQQVILNLLVNAIEATKETDLRPPRIRIASTTASTGRVCVSVNDTGPGFDPAMHERLFDTFFTTKAEGVGMGLAISRTIVEAHAGCLFACLDPQGGAIFRFELPAVELATQS